MFCCMVSSDITTVTRTMPKLWCKITKVHFQFDGGRCRWCRPRLVTRRWLGCGSCRLLVLPVDGKLEAWTQVGSILHHGAEVGWVLWSEAGKLLQCNFMKTKIWWWWTGVGFAEECHEQRNKERHQVNSCRPSTTSSHLCQRHNKQYTHSLPLFNDNTS